METLLLSDEEVGNLISMDDVIGVVEEAFREKGLGRVQMPPKIYLFFKKYNGDLRAMPSYLEWMDISSVKIVNVHPENRIKYGFTNSYGYNNSHRSEKWFPNSHNGWKNDHRYAYWSSWRNCSKISRKKEL